MKHFRIIQSMCRIGLPLAGDPFRHQVERLVKGLLEDGDDAGAQALKKLLEAAPSEHKLKPSRIIQSAIGFGGEKLTSSVQPPVDKETSAPLCEIRAPRTDNQGPVLPNHLSEAIKRIIEEWNHYDSLNAMDAAPPRTCMLFGQPGTGKTQLAYYIGDRLGVPVVLARLDGLISPFLGTTARNIGSLFDFANRYQCLLLLDEFDALAKLRDDPQEVGEIKRVVNTLLQNIDKRKEIGFTLAITNHEGLLDPAVWRRFEIRIQIPLPERSIRAKIIEVYLSPLPATQFDIRLLSWFSEGMSGSDIEGMARSLKRFTAIHGADGFPLIDALRAYAITNATNVTSSNVKLILDSPQEIARTLVSDPDLAVNQQDVGAFLGKDQATISRWLRTDPSLERISSHAE
jgi:hypothetical protein